MPRKLRFPNRRVITLTELADTSLLKIAIKKETTPAEQAREYVEDGIKRDRHLVDRQPSE